MQLVFTCWQIYISCLPGRLGCNMLRLVLLAILVASSISTSSCNEIAGSSSLDMARHGHDQVLMSEMRDAGTFRVDRFNYWDSAGRNPDAQLSHGRAEASAAHATVSQNTMTGPRPATFSYGSTSTDQLLSTEKDTIDAYAKGADDFANMASITSPAQATSSPEISDTGLLQVRGYLLAGDLDGDRAALLAQKDLITNAGVALDTWTATGNPCTFAYVTCNADGTRVAALRLNGTRFSGTVASQLASLTDLTSLDMANNYLSGSIPSQLGSLSSLRILWLHSNGLSGTIPFVLGSLPSLQTLDLYDNLLSGTISSRLGSLSSLQQMHLAINRLSGTIPPQLGSLSSLQSLHLAINRLSGTIPPQLGSLSSLQSLQLHTNQLSGTIPPQLGSLSALQQMGLSRNKLVGTIPPELGDVYNLTLDLSLNPSICGPDPDGITVTRTGTYGSTCPACFHAFSSPGVDWNCTPASPSCVNSACTDDFPVDDRAALLAQKSAITNGGTLLSSWSTSGSLCQFSYVGCNADGTRVEALQLSGLGLSGTLSSALGYLTSLVTLYLYENNLSGTIPPQLGSLGSLQEIALDTNPLSGTIPPELGSLHKLQYMWLNDNQLSGTISPQLGSLSALQLMYLYENNLSGTIPPQLGSLGSLQYIALDTNPLSGTIPPELGSLHELQHMYLYNNNLLSGTIPPQLGSLGSLQRIALDTNQLSGTIPPELGSLHELQYMWLNDNQLSGTIPPQLGSLSALRVMKLSMNKLVGTIPPQLAFLQQLQEVTVFENSWICGPDPVGLDVNRTGTWESFDENTTDAGLFSCPACFNTASSSDVDWNCTPASPVCVEFTACVAPPPEFPSPTCPNEEACKAWESQLADNVLSSLPDPAFLSCASSFNEVTFCPVASGTEADTCACYASQIELFADLSLSNGAKGAYDDQLAQLSNCPSYYFAGCQPYSEHYREGYESCGLMGKWEEIKARVATNALADCTCTGQCPPPSAETVRALLAVKDGITNAGATLDSWTTSGNVCDTFAFINCTGGLVTSLDLSGQGFSGSIATELGSLTALTTLDLYNNHLSGTIPPELGSLSSLQQLDLFHNQLTGTIPPELGSLSSLYWLHMASNQLSGTIPPELGSLYSLQWMDLSNNHLSGSIPPELGSISSLLNLNVSFNPFICGSDLDGITVSRTGTWGLTCPDSSAPFVRSDPHFMAGNGLKYDFMGEAGKIYCMFSDKLLHMNMLMMGARNNPHRKATWMESVSILYWPYYNITISAASPEGIPFTAAHGTVSINGKEMKSKKLSTMVRWHGLTVTRRKTRTTVAISNLLNMEIEVVRATFWEGKEGPGANYLNVQIIGLNVTESVHGVLGQTFRESFKVKELKDPKAKMGEGIIEGKATDYEVSGLAATDCKFSQFLGWNNKENAEAVAAALSMHKWEGEAGADSEDTTPQGPHID